MKPIHWLSSYFNINLFVYIHVAAFQQTGNCHVFLSSSPKYSSISTMQNIPCLSTGTPISIEVPKGQRIKLTYKAFDKTQFKERNDCKQELGLIALKKNNLNITICETGFYTPNSPSHIKQSFISEGNTIHVFLYRLKHYENILLEMKGKQIKSVHFYIFHFLLIIKYYFKQTFCEIISF